MNLEQYENLLEKKKKKIIVGVVGSRRRNSGKDLDILTSCVLNLIDKACKSNADLEFVSGGCEDGADYFIKKICYAYKLPLTEHLPKFGIVSNQYWEMVGAYYARNKLIAKDCHFLIAMVAADRKGGTENTIAYCKELGKKVIVI